VSDGSHEAFMRQALVLAARGRGLVHPNPLVGAVIVRNDAIIAAGYHEEYGGAHAEVNALRSAGEAAAGARMYVTLEPCTHHGRTPPCTDAILAARIGDVVIAASDSNPVATGGADILRAAGVRVTTGILERESRRLNAIFHHWHEHGTPFVTLKLATSAEGHIAAAPGVRTAITGPIANAEVHRMRAMHDAILVGIGTALTDDPLLTVRDGPVVVRRSA
jgi:diaminohydroxyphosphoribosylaminopyrimidine deaminase / 5-amino-6-(5-phosphoribosylamino)uracil reductase